jgi:hypothetical protein
MLRCQAVHDLRKCPVNVGSVREQCVSCSIFLMFVFFQPQTQAQRDQVSRVIQQLFQEYNLKNNPDLHRFVLQVNTQHSGKPQESYLFHDQKKDNIAKSNSGKRLMRPFQSFNAVYDSQHHSHQSNSTIKAASSKISRFPYFGSALPVDHKGKSFLMVGSNQNSLKHAAPKGTDLLQNHEKQPLGGNDNAGIIMKVSTLSNISISHGNENSGNPKQSAKPNLHLQEHHKRAKEKLSSSDNNAADELDMQFIHIDSASNSHDEQHNASNLLSLEPSAVVPAGSSSGNLIDEPNLKLPGTISGNKIVHETLTAATNSADSTIRQALSVARQSVVGNVVEKQPVSNRATVAIMPSRPANNVGSVSKFGVANFMGRKLENKLHGQSKNTNRSSVVKQHAEKDIEAKEFMSVL